MSNQFALLKQKRFLPFFSTQFLGAFNDNVFKTALITLVAFHASSLGNVDSAMMATLLPGLFILPFFLFSASAGQIADKFEKSQIIRLVKVFEIAIMLFASAGFFLHNIWLLGSALFMMGMHSTLFGPVKYAYLPQHLSQNELIGGNGLVEMGTFVAILLGQILGAWLGAHGDNALYTSLTILGLAVLGYLTSRGVPHSPAAEPALNINWNPLTETLKNVRVFWAKQELWLAIVAISWFWFYGATLLAQLPNFAKTTLMGDESVFILLLSFFSIGVGLGSLMCEKLSKGKVELGLVMLGAIGLTIFGIDLYFTANNINQSLLEMLSRTTFTQAPVFSYRDYLTNPYMSHPRLLLDIFVLGLAGGVFIVPLYVLLQTRVESTMQSRVIAANNIMNALFMVVSALASAAYLKTHTIPQLFLAAAILNAVVAVYLCVRQPEYWRSFIAWVKR